MTICEKEDDICSLKEDFNRIFGCSDDFLQRDQLENKFFVQQCSLHSDQSESFELRSGGGMIVMQFCLKGNCHYSNNKGEKIVSFRASEYNFLYFPPGLYHFVVSAQPLEWVNIYIEKEFFLKQLPQEHKFLKCGRAGVPEAIASKNLALSPKIQDVLAEIKSCVFDGHLKSLYTKAKIIELITLQLFQHEGEQVYSSGLKSEEIEKMIFVKELIDSAPKGTYTLACLARTAGTNEQYLKKHFKALYGQTVFGYVLSSRMRRAKEMLLSGEYRIADIAEEVGYKHATHFSSAFKKYFGYLPQKLKPKSLIGGMFFFCEEIFCEIWYLMI